MRLSFIKAIRGLLLLVIPLCFCSCTSLFVIVGDEGTGEIVMSEVLSDGNPGDLSSVVTPGNIYDTWFIAADGNPELLFYRHNRKSIMAADSFSGEKADTFYSHSRYIHNLAVDVHCDQLYFTSTAVIDEQRSLVFYRLDYSDYVDSVSDPVMIYSRPLANDSNWQSDLVVNPMNNGRIYWAETYGSNNSRRKLILSAPLDDLKDGQVAHLDSDSNDFVLEMSRFAVDPKKEHIYWSHPRTEQFNMIGKAKLKYDSSAVEIERWVNNDDSNLVFFPFGISLDHQQRRLYWADRNLQWIAGAYLDSDPEKRVQILHRFDRESAAEKVRHIPTSLTTVRAGKRRGGQK